MSGGSYNYAFHRIEDLGWNLQHQDTDPRRIAFAKLLALMAIAAKDIEYVDSGDYMPGEEHAAIDAVFGFLAEDASKVIKAHAYDRLGDLIKKFWGENQ